uniref:Cleft lip and palate transmembrane protein 1 homolog n=1 Tax=Phallusia mammillata TaxID=59560 RepID=A0A6F9D9Q7_9ASCI|nr:cleft lip and palate transmembrane protein 1 homolog [Phallusia mammillata]
MSDSTAVSESPPAAAPAGASNQPQEAAPQSTWNVISGVLFRFFLMWMFMSWLRGGNKPQEGADKLPSVAAANLFSFGDELSMWVFLNEEKSLTKYSDPSSLLWVEDSIVYGGWDDGPNADGVLVFNSTFPISQKVQSNGSLFLHTFFTKSGYVPHPSMGELYSEYHTVYVTKQMNKFKRRTIKKTQNLLTGETKTDPELLKRMEEHGSKEIISHWHPNMTINLVADLTPWSRGKVPAPLDQYVHFKTDNPMVYEPIVFLNDYWNLLRDYTPINDSIKEVQVCITLQPITLFKLQMYASQNMRNQWYNILGEDYVQDSDEDQDSLKEAILETNPYMLGLTVIVSLVHSVFEFLAFKNDIQFWKSRKTLEGLSVRSVIFGVFQTLVVLLYVIDNDTNFIIKVSIFVGCLIDAWKITKVVSVTFDWSNLICGILPRISFKDKSSYVESETKKYDQLAFKYLGIALFPLLVIYAVYSIIYDEHKGLYSYILSMLYGFLLTFGFIMMTPQLFINYKLKSVAHLPWRMLTYKALNTFIDDIFAFVIKMPTLYRVGCFRDDIVFFIYLYQRYAYRVDPKRVNEFGTSGEEVTEPAAITSTDKKND